MKTILFFNFILLTSLNTYADNPISGSISVYSNSIETYTVNWENWDPMYENYANVTWDVDNGIVLSSDKHNVTIQWFYSEDWQHTELSIYGNIEVSEDLGGGNGNLEVSITNFIEGTSTTCEGILGPPTHSIDFGSGPNYGPALSSNIISYAYKDYCTISPGQYTITNSTNACRSAWINLLEDHTSGDVNGYMLMIDGNNSKGDIYRATVNGLDPQYKYEFSAYVANISTLSSSQKPELVFLIRDINNNLIERSNDIIIPYDNISPWKRISYIFELPVGTNTVQVVLKNNNTKHDGNDFVVDDISFAPCYPPMIASFDPAILKTISESCNSGTFNLYSRWPTSNIPFNNPIYKWQKSIDNNTWADIPNSNSLNLTSQSETSPGKYYYRIIASELSDPSNFLISNVINHNVIEINVLDKEYWTDNCKTENIVMVPNFTISNKSPSTPALTFNYLWTPSNYLSDPTILNPILDLPTLPNPNYTDPFTVANYLYNFSAETVNYTGCEANGDLKIRVRVNRPVIVPNAFTPDGDGINDTFRAINLEDYVGAKFTIVNRWGQTVFQTTQPPYEWNGIFNSNPQEPGNYVWYVEMPYCPNQIGATQGNLVLIR